MQQKDMDTSTVNHPDSALITSSMFAEVLPAYLNCPNEVQALIQQMAKVVNDPAATEEARRGARAAIAAALFGGGRNEAFGVDLEDYAASRVSARVKAIDTQLNEEEAVFAERLAALLEKKSMSQAELAKAVGVGQSAISMMLARRCRPQRRTVEKIARALNVAAEELWPHAQP
jgi:lambda repressor-like predicted transcriptional regulator